MNKIYTSLIILLFVFFACGGRTKAEDRKELPEQFLGEWCGNDISVVDEGTIFQFHFEEDIVTYYTRGPFQEELTVKVISDVEVELYFDMIMGSISFSEAQGDMQNKECKTLVAKCKLLSENEMEVMTFKDECGQIPEDITITLHKLNEGEFCSYASYENDYNDDPFVEVKASFYSRELIRLLGKREPEIITDFFLLLPDDVCFDLSVDERKKMVDGERVGEWSQMAIGQKDIENRYLSLSGAFEGTWEMYAQQDDGFWLVAVNSQSCGPLCMTDIAQSYIYEDRRLMSTNYANLAGFQDVWAELFFDFDQLTALQIEEVKEVWDDSIGNILFRLPQDGKNITMYIDDLPYSDIDIPEKAFKEITVEMWK